VHHDVVLTDRFDDLRPLDRAVFDDQ